MSTQILTFLYIMLVFCSFIIEANGVHYSFKLKKAYGSIGAKLALFISYTVV